MASVSNPRQVPCSCKQSGGSRGAAQVHISAGWEPALVPGGQQHVESLGPYSIVRRTTNNLCGRQLNSHHLHNDSPGGTPPCRWPPG